MDTYFIIFSFVVLFFIEDSVIGIDEQMNGWMNLLIN